MKSLIKKISIVVFSNIISLLVSTIVVLIVPKFISVSQYGFFQLYIFYTGYIGFLNFGWPEGIMLRYGGMKYSDLDKNGLKTEILLFTIISNIIGLIIVICALLEIDTNSLYVWIGVGLCIIVYLPRAFMQVILHMTNRINEYAIGIIIERVVYFIGVICLLFFKVKEYQYYIMCDILGRLLALIYIGIKCKDILLSKGIKVKSQIPEIFTNIKIGIKLMLANLAGLFIIGIVRQCIKTNWDIEIFAKVSLTLSISNMLIVFIRAIAVVFFPFLKRLNENILPKIYKSLRIGLITPLFALLIVYYPIKTILSFWLPNYSESLYYMALLFPICIYECKTSLLIETYMKTLRMEKQLLMVNIISVALSIILSILVVFGLNDIELSVLVILLLVSFRCILSEILLSRKMNISILKDILLEFIVVWSFVLFNWKIEGILALILYIIILTIFILINKNEILIAFGKLKDIIYKEKMGEKLNN